MKTVVIKIGTSSLINDSAETNETYLNLKSISMIVEICSKLKRAGHRVVLVSSGAVGCGRHVLNIKTPPKTLKSRQALAAIGQVHLMAKYESLFGALKETCAQVLITYDTFRKREEYLNAENTIKELFDLGVIPIVNENDTVATQELRSENDTMSAMVASMVGADNLFLLTDVEGLYTSNPKLDPEAKLVKVIENASALNALLKTLEIKGGSSWGSGGMGVKINAASLAASLGIQTSILATKFIENIEDLLYDQKEYVTGTTFKANPQPPSKRKRWIHGLRFQGEITLDEGAINAVLNKHDIHAVGVTHIEGDFPPLSAIKIVDFSKKEVARALINYSSSDLRVIKGLNSEQIINSDVSFSGPLINRKNLVVLLENNTSNQQEEEESSLFTTFE